VTNLAVATRAKVKVSPARLAAFSILRRVEEEGAFASVLLSQGLEALSGIDRALTHELTLGVLRWRLLLDSYLAHYSQRSLERVDLPVLIALRLGLYQLRFLSRVPAPAAINEAVELVRIARLASADKFVNAVLRRALREPDFDPLAKLEDPLQKLAIETSHPRWLVERWANAFSLEHTIAFLRANNEPAPVSFRLAGREPASAEESILEALTNAGGSLSPSKVVSGAWRIIGATGTLHKLADEGQVYIQDEASQLVAHLVAPQALERILDVCAAPGSKTTHLATLTSDRAAIIAGDIHVHRLRTVIQAVRLQGLSSINCIAFDGVHLLPFKKESFDRVLVDAPCTGTGTLRRNPEIRWRIRPEDIADLSARQGQILANAAEMVRPGGRLVYSTCSVETEENEAVIRGFLRDQPGFSCLLVPLAALPQSEYAIRMWPNLHGTDGFFIAVFERTL